MISAQRVATRAWFREWFEALPAEKQASVRDGLRNWKLDKRRARQKELRDARREELRRWDREHYHANREKRCKQKRESLKRVRNRVSEETWKRIVARSLTGSAKKATRSKRK